MAICLCVAPLQTAVSQPFEKIFGSVCTHLLFDQRRIFPWKPQNEFFFSAVALFLMWSLVLGKDTYIALLLISLVLRRTYLKFESDVSGTS